MKNKSKNRQTRKGGDEYLATPLLRFSGKNLQNNDVTVDYSKRTIKFDPLAVTSQSSLWLLLISKIIFLSFVVSMWVIDIPAILFISYRHLELSPSPTFVIPLILWLYCVIFIGGLYSYLFFFDTFFREWVYPRFNSRLTQWIGYLLFNFKVKKRFVVNPDAIIKNMILIPMFNNVELEWETTKDFSSKLKRVDIRHIFDDDAYKWFAVFHFRGKIKCGSMEVKYI